MDTNAFDFQEIKKWDSLYFNKFYSLILAGKHYHLFVIYHYIWQSSEINGSYSPTFAMKIVHNTT